MQQIASNQTNNTNAFIANNAGIDNNSVVNDVQGLNVQIVDFDQGLGAAISSIGTEIVAAFQNDPNVKTTQDREIEAEDNSVLNFVAFDGESKQLVYAFTCMPKANANTMKEPKSAIVRMDFTQYMSKTDLTKEDVDKLFSEAAFHFLSVPLTEFPTEFIEKPGSKIFKNNESSYVAAVSNAKNNNDGQVLVAPVEEITVETKSAFQRFVDYLQSYVETTPGPSQLRVAKANNVANPNNTRGKAAQVAKANNVAARGVAQSQAAQVAKAKNAAARGVAQSQAAQVAKAKNAANPNNTQSQAAKAAKAKNAAQAAQATLAPQGLAPQGLAPQGNNVAGRGKPANNVAARGKAAQNTTSPGRTI